MKNETKKRICVFCGSSMGIDPENKKISFLVGKIIGELEFDLVYGGGNNGLMGVVAKGAMSQGAKVYGIIPKFLTKIESPMDNINLTLTNTMRNRKSKMYKISSAYLILSGGIGTLDEFVEVLTLIQLKQIKNKPVLLFNVNNYWNLLLEMLKKMVKEQFLEDSFLQNIVEFKKVDHLKSFLKRF